LGLTLVGWEALNTARIEAGIPWFGIDMDMTNLLPETGLEDVLASGTKGCYLGQEIIARMRTYGSPNKKLMGLRVEGRDVPQAGDGIVRAGEMVGRVTSGCDSPALRRPIAMGYVKRGAYEPGTAVEIVRGDDRLAATVVALGALGLRPHA
jgi:aminomethyltransferase